ncbi:MAG: BamA/TamA family outer membrane protein [Gammaproteobacteria bacterium]|nr:BamA/TamA family outer membrane protein [Gammaproteobacteria bacterium]
MNRFANIPIRFLSIAIVLLLLALPASADELRIVISGVEGPILENVRNRVEPFRLSGNVRLSRRGLKNIRQNSIDRARAAMRPFGYYHAEVEATTQKVAEGSWRLELTIDPGPPVIVRSARIDVRGEGRALDGLQSWKSSWPLLAGSVLNQPLWDERKQQALDIAESEGYLQAEFIAHRMDIDLLRNEAELELVLETGEQAVMGTVTFNQDTLNPAVLESLPRFRAGDPYSAWIQEKFRIDIWQTGYFGRIEVIEDRHLDESPPRVDLVVNLEPRKPNTWQGAVGVGSDTGVRMTATWTRHLLSRRGDRLSIGTGWKDHNNEFFLRGNYRIPRRERSKQFWTAEAQYRQETQGVRVRADDVGEEFIQIATADISDYSLRLGRLKVRDRKAGFEQLFETVYAQLVRESSTTRISPTDPGFLAQVAGNADVRDSVDRTHSSLAFGVDWSYPVIRGSGWEASGYNHRAWVFTSNEAWGSDSDFSQLYLSTRWNLPWGERFKLLFRAEAGYSDAEVTDVDLQVEDQTIRLSLTDLPNLYRFKAGGSMSVRGYGFERLSNNGIGSNNIVTASAELEMKVRENWSLATFYDVGNAFNDWDRMSLKQGVGFGVRWYTIAGAVRLDYAKALDLEGEPWRIHFTIGTSLL